MAEGPRKFRLASETAAADRPRTAAFELESAQVRRTGSTTERPLNQFVTDRDRTVLTEAEQNEIASLMVEAMGLRSELSRLTQDVTGHPIADEETRLILQEMFKNNPLLPAFQNPAAYSRGSREHELAVQLFDNGCRLDLLKQKSRQRAEQQPRGSE